MAGFTTGAMPGTVVIAGAADALQAILKTANAPLTDNARRDSGEN
ncbi:hypothetical protein CAter10_1395 [Collimonas arenae]|nr:hypothetical protein CAter10_1395 [Collimonas arenae]